MKPLTDAQLTWLFTKHLSNHNGFQCCRRLTENGIPETAYICQGKTKIVEGKLKYENTCGEPCSFVCKDADRLRQEIEHVQAIDEYCRVARTTVQ